MCVCILLLYYWYSLYVLHLLIFCIVIIYHNIVLAPWKLDLQISVEYRFLLLFSFFSSTETDDERKKLHTQFDDGFCTKFLMQRNNSWHSHNWLFLTFSYAVCRWPLPFQSNCDTSLWISFEWINSWTLIRKKRISFGIEVYAMSLKAEKTIPGKITHKPIKSQIKYNKYIFQ